MMHGSALMGARLTELEAQLELMTKRKTRKRKQIQKGGTLEYSEGAAQVAAKASAALQPSKKARGREGQDKAQPAVRRCGNCGGTGHNARTCQVAKEESSKSDASTQYIFSDSSNDGSDNTKS